MALLDLAYDDHYDAPMASMAVTYSEIRSWAVWLRIFTASDLADAMGVDLSQGEKGIKALIWHGIVADTGEVLDGVWGPERLVSYVPLPPGPREHETRTPPERSTPGCYELAQATGMPVRIRTERQMRGLLSTPGARQHHKQRELAYQRAEEAKRKRADVQRKKKNLEPKWARKKSKGTVVVFDD